VEFLQIPSGPGVRWDGGIATGSDVTLHYDPMLAKLIVHAPTRDKALDKLAAALEQSTVIGPHNNVGFLAALARAREFRSGKFDTSFIDQHLSELVAPAGEPDNAAIAAAAERLFLSEQARTGASAESELPPSPWDVADAFQLSGARSTTMLLSADGAPVVAQAEYSPNGMSVTVSGAKPARDARVIETTDGIFVLNKGRQLKVTRRDVAGTEGENEVDGVIRAPMHGKVLAVFVDDGAAVVRGQRLAIIEAMKMEHTLTAPADGTVAEVSVSADSQVAEGAKLMVVRSDAT
jgi:3-methylcrotonyl-CoA carboxylase alpha subunit